MPPKASKNGTPPILKDYFDDEETAKPKRKRKLFCVVSPVFLIVIAGVFAGVLFVTHYYLRKDAEFCRQLQIRFVKPEGVAIDDVNLRLGRQREQSNKSVWCRKIRACGS